MVLFVTYQFPYSDRSFSITGLANKITLHKYLVVLIHSAVGKKSIQMHVGACWSQCSADGLEVWNEKEEYDGSIVNLCEDHKWVGSDGGVFQSFSCSCRWIQFVGHASCLHKSSSCDPRIQKWHRRSPSMIVAPPPEEEQTWTEGVTCTLSAKCTCTSTFLHLWCFLRSCQLNTCQVHCFFTCTSHGART